MFRCEICHDVIGPGVRCQRVVVETRQVTYPLRERAKLRPRRQRGSDAKKSGWIFDPGGCGFETVREVKVCPNCQPVTAELREVKSVR